MHTPQQGSAPQGGVAAARKVERAPQRLRGEGVEVGFPTFMEANFLKIQSGGSNTYGSIDKYGDSGE